MGYNYSSTARAAELSESVTGSATVLKVSSVAGLPAVPFTVVVDVATESEEVCTVTGLAGLNLTVTRGEDGTAAVPHQVGAVVRHMVVARDLRQAQAHIDATSNVHGIGASSAVVGTATTQTLTGKTISGASNTFQAVPGSALNAGSVTATQLGTGAVQTDKISDLNVTTAKLADNAVTTAKLGDDQVTTAKLPDAAVTAPKLAANSVETAKIPDAAVTAAKIADLPTPATAGRPVPRSYVEPVTGTVDWASNYGRYTNSYPEKFTWRVHMGRAFVDGGVTRTGLNTTVTEGVAFSITEPLPVDCRPAGVVAGSSIVLGSVSGNWDDTFTVEAIYDDVTKRIQIRHRQRTSSGGAIAVGQNAWWAVLTGLNWAV